MYGQLPNSNYASFIRGVNFFLVLFYSFTLLNATPETKELLSKQTNANAESPIDTCNISINISNKICHINNPDTPDDDTYTFDLTVTNSGNSGYWEGGYNNSFLGVYFFSPIAYDTTIKLGPFPAGRFTSSNTSPPIIVEDGLPISLSVSDVENRFCGTGIEVQPPDCSPPIADCSFNCVEDLPWLVEMYDLVSCCTTYSVGGIGGAQEESICSPGQTGMVQSAIYRDNKVIIFQACHADNQEQISVFNCNGDLLFDYGTGIDGPINQDLAAELFDRKPLGTCVEICNNLIDDDLDGKTDRDDTDCGACDLSCVQDLDWLKELYDVSSCNIVAKAVYNDQCVIIKKDCATNSTSVENQVFDYDGNLLFSYLPDNLAESNSREHFINDSLENIQLLPSCIEICDNGIDDDLDGKIDDEDNDCTTSNCSDFCIDDIIEKVSLCSYDFINSEKAFKVINYFGKQLVRVHTGYCGIADNAPTYYFNCDGSSFTNPVIWKYTTEVASVPRCEVEEDIAILESGTATVVQSSPDQWHTVNLQNDFDKPVVIAQISSYNGNQPATVRVRNTTSQSFEFQIDEWEYLDGRHGSESISYVVVEEGNHVLDNGTIIQAGSTTADGSFKAFSFSQAFSSAPALFGQVASYNSPKAVTSCIKDVSSTGFAAKIQREESDQTPHSEETFYWIAIERGLGIANHLKFEANVTRDIIRHRFARLRFRQSFSDAPVFLAAMQTQDGSDPAGIRARQLSNKSVRIKIEEEKSKDREINHTTEKVGFWAIEPGTIIKSAEVTANGRAANPSYFVFEAQVSERKVDLEWLTNQNKNIDYFEIERAENGTNFEVLKRVENQKLYQSEEFYSILDNRPLIGTNYYRIKYYYQDGNHEYSNIKKVKFNIDLNNFSAYPNPTDGVLFLNLKEFFGKSASFQIYNNYGHLIKEWTIDNIAKETISTDLSEYSDGLFHVIVNIDGKQSIHKKIVLVSAR